MDKHNMFTRCPARKLLSMHAVYLAICDIYIGVGAGEHIWDLPLRYKVTYSWSWCLAHSRSAALEIEPSQEGQTGLDREDMGVLAQALQITHARCKHTRVHTIAHSLMAKCRGRGQ